MACVVQLNKFSFVQYTLGQLLCHKIPFHLKILATLKYSFKTPYNSIFVIQLNKFSFYETKVTKSRFRVNEKSITATIAPH